jgi:hypothetical protein
LAVSLITTGGSSNTVSCTGISCDTGELVVWNLGSLPPGGGVTVTMPPVVHISTPNGTLIQFEAELRVDGFQQSFVSKTVFIGTAFDGSDGLLGDYDNSGAIDLKDLILALQIIAAVGLEPGVQISVYPDVDGNYRIGLAEAIYCIQVISETRQ